MKNLLFILLFTHVFSFQISAQEIVFPYYYEPSDKIRFSDNGSLILALKASKNEFYIIDASSSCVLAKESSFGLNIIQFALSYNGEYLAFVDINKDETLIHFYHYTGVDQLELLNSVVVGNCALSCGSEQILINSNKENDFYLKLNASDGVMLHEKFWYITKFSNYLDQYYKQFEIGSMCELEGDEPEFGFLGDVCEFQGFDLTADDRYFTALTSFTYNNIDIIPSEADIEYPDRQMSYGILEWGMKKKGQEYKQMFPSERHCENNANSYNACSNFPELNFFPSNSIYALRYYENEQKVFGLMDKAEFKEIFKREIGFVSSNNNYGAKHIENGFPELFPDNFNSLLPFSFDLRNNTFHLYSGIDPERPFCANDLTMTDSLSFGDTIQEMLKQMEFIGIPYSWHFDRVKPILYVYGVLNGITERITSIELSTGQIDHYDFNYGTLPHFTDDNKAIFSISNRIANNNSFEFKVLDLETFTVLANCDLNNKFKLSEVKEVYLNNNNDDRRIFVQTENCTFQFSINESRFAKILKPTDKIFLTEDSLLSYENTFRFATPVTDSLIIFPFKHHCVSADTSFGKYIYSQFESNYGHITSKTDEDKVVSGSIDPLYPQEIICSKDSITGTGYHNYMIEALGFEYHVLTNKMAVACNGVMEKWNIKTKKNEFVFRDRDEFIKAFDLMQNDSLMIVASKEGNVTLWNFISNKLIARIYMFNDQKNWLIILPDNYYFGTREAISRISFAFNKNALPIEFFELKYNRPDLVLKTLGCSDNKLILAYNKAYLKRLARVNIHENQLTFDVDIPYLKILDKSLIPAETLCDSVELNLNLFDVKYKLDHINIYLNGVPQNTISVSKNNVSIIKQKITLKLTSGINEIEITTTNNKGIESEKDKVKINCLKQKASDLYIVAVGANIYSQNEFNLKYPEKDVVDFVELNKINSSFNRIRTVIFTGQNVNKNILNSIRDTLKNTRLEDEILIYYAGHGVLDKNLDYFLGTYNIDFNNPNIEGIKYEDLEEVMFNTKALKKVILLDACHSGEFEKDEVLASDKEISNADGIKFRNVGNGIKAKEKTNMNTTNLLSTVFSDLRRGTGATVISSAGGAEYAMESDQWKNGLFTYCLLHGLKDKAADANGDGQIMLSELQQYLRTEVTKLSNGAQQPTSRIENLSMDFRVW